MIRTVPLIPYVAVAAGLYGLHSAWAALGLYHAGVLITLCLLPDTRPESKNPTVRRVWVWLVGCVFAFGGVAMYLLWPVLSHAGNDITHRLADYGVTKHTWPLLAIYFCIANSTLEEFFWRGRLLSSSIRLQPNDLLFAGYHAFVLLAFAQPVWAIPVFVAVALAAWLWRMLRIGTGSLTVPIITHIIADVSIALAVHLKAFA